MNQLMLMIKLYVKLTQIKMRKREKNSTTLAVSKKQRNIFQMDKLLWKINNLVCTFLLLFFSWIPIWLEQNYRI